MPSMSLTRIVTVFLCVLALALAWRYRHAEFVQDLLHPPVKRPLKIEFDNGSARRPEASAASAPGKGQAQAMPLGALRRCVKGAEVSYTNSYCAAGAKEFKVDRGTVNVVGSGVPKAPAQDPALAGAAAGNGLSEATIRQQAIDRIVGQ